MKNLSHYLILMLSLALVSLPSCKDKDKMIPPDNTNVDPNSSELSNFVSTLSTNSLRLEIKTPELRRTTSDWDEQSSMFCTAKEYRWGPHFSEGFLLEPSSDVIFPGAILDGNSIASGAYTLISLDRTGGTISLQQLPVDSTNASFDNTVKSSVQQALTGLVNQPLNGSTPAAITFKTTSVDTRKQFDIASQLKIGLKDKLNIDAAFDYNSDKQINRFLLEFQQVYYEVSYDAKSSADKYFKSNVKADDLKNFIDGNLAPVYVSNVKYGRLAYFAVTTKLSSSEFQASLNIDANGASWDVQSETELENKLMAAETNITGTIVGGSGQDAVLALSGIQGIKDFITNGGDFGPSSPGSPVAYSLRSLNDNSLFTVQTIDSYVINECKTIEGSIQIAAMAHVDGSQTTELNGSISYQIGYEGGELLPSSTDLFIVPGNRFILSTNGIPVTNANEILAASRLIYNPERFNDAYIQVNVDLRNSADWELGTRYKRNGTITTDLKKTYRIKLSSLADSQGLGAGWSTRDNAVFDLKLEIPGKTEAKRYCDKTGLIGCQSPDGNNTDADVHRRASDISVSFLINAQKIE